jgi:hypothetical protein
VDEAGEDLMANTGRVITWWTGNSDLKEAREGGCWPWPLGEPMCDKDLDPFLWETIRTNGLEQSFRQAFQITEPLWFGLWMDSPLSAPRCAFLGDLLAALYVEVEEMAMNRVQEVETSITEALKYEHLEEDITELKEITVNSRASALVRLKALLRFIEALQACTTEHIPLYIDVNPLGHTDFGLYTIFSHCPRCKATSHYTGNKQIACQVCGFHFIPAQTSTSTEMRRASV